MEGLIKEEIKAMNEDIMALMGELRKNKVIVYPLSKGSLGMKEFLEQKLGILVDFVCTDNLPATGNKVISFDEFLKYKEVNEVTVFLSNQDKDFWFYDFWRFEGAGIPCSHIINYNQLNYYMFLCNGYCVDDYLRQLDEIKNQSAYLTLKNLQQCKDVYEILEDDLSKKVYLRLLAKKIMECDYFFDVYSPNQYFEESIIQLSDREIFFDVGAFDGDTIEQFMECSKGRYKYIYAFEPNSQMFRMLVDNASGYDNIAFFNAGLYDDTRTVPFMNMIWGSSYVVEDEGNQLGCEEKFVIKGDTLHLSPTFIKMDIEGGEWKALEGLKDTIQSAVPKLAVSAYHKTEDLWVIPLFIKNINPDYKIYFRHHSYMYSETVCYASI